MSALMDDEFLRARICAIERELADQVELCLRAAPHAKGAIRMDLAELCGQRRRLLGLLGAPEPERKQDDSR